MDVQKLEEQFQFSLTIEIYSFKRSLIRPM